MMRLASALLYREIAHLIDVVGWLDRTKTKKVRNAYCRYVENLRHVLAIDKILKSHTASLV